VAKGHNSFFILIFGPCSLAAQLADVSGHCVARIALSRADANHILSLIFSLEGGVLKGFRILPSVVVMGASFGSAVSGHMFLLVALSGLYGLQLAQTFFQKVAMPLIYRSPCLLFPSLFIHRRVCLMSH